MMMIHMRDFQTTYEMCDVLTKYICNHICLPVVQVRTVMYGDRQAVLYIFAFYCKHFNNNFFFKKNIF